MATRKRSNKKKAKKVTPKKKAPKKLAKKSATPGKKSAKKAPSKRAAVKTKVAAQKKTASKARAPKKRVAAHRQSVDAEALVREGGTARSGGQSGDLQGLSNIAGANSESVDELLEEGNALEADVVKGVEDAGDEGEVRTHEVSEDDVPEEYLEKD